MPLVSIITPAYNAEATLRRCFDSLCAQTLEDWEHIVVDDGSTDGTPSLLDALYHEDARLKALRIPQNEGAASARNRGIEMAKGRFIAFIDSDDEWLPDKLRAQIGFMLTEQVPFSYGAYYLGYENSSRPRRLFTPPARIAYASLLRSCPVGCLTAAYDREFFGTQYMPNVRRGQDWGLWLTLTRLTSKAAQRYPGAHAIYHRTPGSISSSKMRKLRDVWSIYRAHENMSRSRAGLSIMLLVASSLTKQIANRFATFKR